MSESDYIDVLDKPFIYTVGLIIYANSLSGCIQPMSDGMGREFAYLSSHFIPNWGKPRVKHQACLDVIPRCSLSYTKIHIMCLNIRYWFEKI